MANADLRVFNRGILRWRLQMVAERIQHRYPELAAIATKTSTEVDGWSDARVAEGLAAFRADADMSEED